MRTIYKYELEITDGPQVVHTFNASTLVHCGIQNSDRICLWLEVDTGFGPGASVFYVVGTGHKIPENTAWAGTVIAAPFVWHVYEKSEQ